MSLNFESVAVLPGETEDVVYVSVLRKIGGVDRRFIEKFAPRAFDEQADVHFVDCGVQYSGAATATIAGLSHLEGATVSIQGDGAVFPDQVVSGGQVVLSSTVTKASVGLSYRSTVKPMRLDQLYANAPGGATHGSKRSIKELVISFYETLDAKYGTDTANLLPIEWRSTEHYGSAPLLYTGDKIVTMDGGFDPEDPIVISTNGPRPCTVRAIVARMQVTGR